MKIAFDEEKRTFSVLGRSIREVDIDFTNISSEDDVHNLLQSKLGLDPSYGRNMDALYDMLTAVSIDLRIVLSHWRHKGIHVRKAVEVMMAAKQVNGHLTVWTVN
jgi:RNAse (barnase) inhibitor barstar